MLISHQRRFVFIHVPKSAGTSIRTALRHYADLEGVGQLYHASAQQARALMPTAWSRYFRFAVLRNPWELMHSDYWYSRTLAHPEPPGGAFAEKCRRAAGQTFADFVRHEAQPNGLYHAYCCDDGGGCLLSRILRFERLDEEWPALLATLKLPAIELPRLNCTAGRPDWRADYTPELAAIVAAAFAPAIAAGGFTFDDARW